MDTYQPNRIVRLLTAIFSVIYFAGYALGVVLLLMVPTAEVLADADDLKKLSFAVPATVDLPDVQLQSTWDGRTGTVALARTDSKLRVPFSLAPGSFRAVMYVEIAILYGMAMLFIVQLRALFRSARDGAPFDPRNAGRLRWMGGLIIAGHVVGTLFSAWQARVVLGTMSTITAGSSSAMALDEKIVFSFNEGVIMAGLMVFALAEIFKRGTLLEEEQSLVV